LAAILGSLLASCAAWSVVGLTGVWANAGTPRVMASAAMASSFEWCMVM